MILRRNTLIIKGCASNRFIFFRRHFIAADEFDHVVHVDAALIQFDCFFRVQNVVFVKFHEQLFRFDSSQHLFDVLSVLHQFRSSFRIEETRVLEN